MRDNGVEVFDAMARSMRIRRHSGENRLDYVARVAYSCARPWVSAFCIDDGADGYTGLSKQGINARLKGWILALDDLVSGLADWFGVKDGKISSVYNRLIDIDDIVARGFSNRYVAHKPRAVQLARDGKIIVGAFDMSGEAGNVCGTRLDEAVTTGLCTFVKEPGEPDRRYQPFWETEWDLLKWERESDVGSVDYLNLASKRWGLYKDELWTGHAEWVNGMTLARLRSQDGPYQHIYVARPIRSTVYLSHLSASRANALWLYLREASGNGVRGRVTALDDLHVRMEGVPIMMLSSEYRRYVDALTWPVDGVDDMFCRIARRETVSTLRELLGLCHVAMREV